MSTKPVLYYSPRSAPCRAVLLTSGALNLELDLRSVNMALGEHLKPEFLKLNPLHTIPVLDDNGTVVTDSHLICSYLADKYDTKGTLYPKEPNQRRLVDARLYFDCGHLFPRVRFIIEPILYFGVCDIPSNRVTYLQRAYDGLERCLTPGPYLAGEHLTIADLCAIATVSTAAAVAEVYEEQYPKVVDWINLMKSLPYYKQYNEAGLELLVKILNSKIKQRQVSRSALQ